jgi:type IV pilus assembly protein PilV
MSLSASTIRRGRSARGFTMIEVLVTLVIMMFGLLGIAGLILKSQKAGYEAYQRNQALMMAADMAERMKSNRVYPTGVLNSGPYLTLTPGVGAGQLPLNPDCSSLAHQPIPVGTPCTAAQVATYDLSAWNNELAGTQETSTATGPQVNVGGILNARGCIESVSTGGGTPIPAGAVRISVAWQGSQGTVPPTSSNCGFGIYGGPAPAAADSYRRVVSIDIM